MKTKAEIEEFLAEKSYCGICSCFKVQLEKIYKEKVLAAAQEYIENYDGFVCQKLDSFLFLE